LGLHPRARRSSLGSTPVTRGDLKAGSLKTQAALSGALIALLLTPRVGDAQTVESSVELGGVALRYADTLSTTAAILTPRITADWNSTSVEAFGTYSQFTTGGWATQGILSASQFVPVRHGLFGELSGFAGGSTHSDGTRTGEFIANGRLHVSRRGNEVFAGLGVGRTWDDAAWRSIVLGEAGVSLTLRQTTAMLTITPTMVNDSIKYADTQASLTRKGDRVELGALLGFRAGDQITTLSANVKSWASASGVFWMTPGIALVAGVGNYPIDPTQGFPGGRFASLSVRLARRERPSEASESPADEPLPAAPTASAIPAVTAFSAQRRTDGMVTLQVRVPSAQLVEINGDFTNWDPIKLTPSGPDSWSVTVPMKNGKYQMNVRVNGGKWIAPPGLLSMSDEFGGTVGLLVIE